MELPGSTKYGPGGMFSEDSFRNMGLPVELEKTLIEAANHSLAGSTWSVYRTAKKNLLECQRTTGMNMNLPLGTEQVLGFTSWMLTVKKVRPKTVESYLAGLRKLHQVQGLPVGDLRSEVVNTVLKGASNLRVSMDRQGEGGMKRLPVTLEVMRTLKMELKVGDYSRSYKRLVWAVSCICFNGGFRIHEVLSRTESYFDPTFTLLGQDITIRKVKVGKGDWKIIQVKLKSPKEDRIGKEVLVDVYESKGCCCPVKAMEKWLRTNPRKEKGKPAFRMEDSTPFTGKRLNRTLLDCLGKHGPGKGRISSHSFRSGIATMMGSLGFTDQEIMGVGRWSSRAFEDYLKQPRTKRAEMARRIAGWKL